MNAPPRHESRVAIVGRKNEMRFTQIQIACKGGPISTPEGEQFEGPISTRVDVGVRLYCYIIIGIYGKNVRWTSDIARLLNEGETLYVFCTWDDYDFWTTSEMEEYIGLISGPASLEIYRQKQAIALRSQQLDGTQRAPDEYDAPQTPDSDDEQVIDQGDREYDYFCPSNN